MFRFAYFGRVWHGIGMVVHDIVVLEAKYEGVQRSVKERAGVWTSKGERARARTNGDERGLSWRSAGRDTSSVACRS